MESVKNRSQFTLIIVFFLALAASMYFAFAAVQGDYGVFRRAEIEADILRHRATFQSLEIEVARMENLTRRLSDTYLDLDLLDQQARNVLGMARPNELILQ